MLAQRSAQLREQIEGFRQQMTSTKDQSRLIGEELTNLKELQTQGYASANRVRELQRTEAGLKGAQADLAANAARSGEQIGEVQMQALGLDSQRAEDVAKDLRDVEFQLGDLAPKLAAMKSQLAKTRIESPASGQVVGLSVFTVGGVIGPGQKILEVVPDRTPLVVEANVQPTDADDLYVGQMAEVKIAAFHERDLPVLKGEVTKISADALTDERSGQKYFTAEVTVPPSELKQIESVRGNDAQHEGRPAGAGADPAAQAHGVPVHGRAADPGLLALVPRALGGRGRSLRLGRLAALGRSVEGGRQLPQHRLHAGARHDEVQHVLALQADRDLEVAARGHPAACTFSASGARAGASGSPLTLRSARASSAKWRSPAISGSIWAWSSSKTCSAPPSTVKANHTRRPRSAPPPLGMSAIFSMLLRPSVHRRG